MLVIASDIHLTDGSSGETIHSGAFVTFRERLRDLAYDASWRLDGAYKPIEKLDVVLLGDILDLIRSTRWLNGDIRPWSDTKDPAFAAKIAEIVGAVLANNQESVAILKSLNDGKTITLPPATTTGDVALVSRDPAARERVPVTVNLHYVLGNHDWFLHLPGKEFNQMRKAIVEQMALCNASDAPFPHDPKESAQLLQTYAEHAVFARHGDIYDSFNYEQTRDASSLGDAIVVELIDRFPQVVKAKLGAQLKPECIAGLNEIDNVRPTLIIPVWINGLLERTCVDPDQVKAIHDIWDSLVDDFLKIEFVRSRPWLKRFELEALLKFSCGASFRRLADLTGWNAAKLLGADSAFYPHAFSEPVFQDDSAHFIVYGHTHHYEIVPLTVPESGASQEGQTYINSGTWRAVHERAMYRPHDQEFAGYHVMTYLAFFKPDERKGRRFETWSGALGKS